MKFCYNAQMHLIYCTLSQTPFLKMICEAFNKLKKITKAVGVSKLILINTCQTLTKIQRLKMTKTQDFFSSV